MVNLVGNAIKFTERGEVVVDVASATQLERRRRRRLQFSVADTGIGIPAEKHAGDLRAFEQADGSTTRRTAAPAWGWRSRTQLVELMGGASGSRARLAAAARSTSPLEDGHARLETHPD